MTSNELTWRAVSLTYIVYPEGDLIGLLLAWMSLLPIFIIVSFLTLITMKRDLHTTCYFVGLLLNETVNYAVKNIIKEPRPVVYSGWGDQDIGYGMPSSHAQFMSFFTAYLTLFLFIRLHHNYDAFDNLWKYATWLLCLLLTALVMCSRIYLGYHTLTQVLCGALVGGVTGFVWFFLVHCCFTQYFSVIASWPVSEYLMVRDSTLIPNSLWFEYCSHRNEVRSRQRKQQ